MKIIIHPYSDPVLFHPSTLLVGSNDNSGLWNRFLLYLPIYTLRCLLTRWTVVDVIDMIYVTYVCNVVFISLSLYCVFHRNLFYRNYYIQTSRDQNRIPDDVITIVTLTPKHWLSFLIKRNLCYLQLQDILFILSINIHIFTWKVTYNIPLGVGCHHTNFSLKTEGHHKVDPSRPCHHRRHRRMSSKQPPVPPAVTWQSQVLGVNTHI